MTQEQSVEEKFEDLYSRLDNLETKISDLNKYLDIKIEENKKTKEIQELAKEERLKVCSSFSSQAIPIISLLEIHGYRTQYAVSCTKDKSLKNVLGAIDTKDKIILLNEDIKSGEQRFVASYILGIILLNDKLSENYIVYKKDIDYSGTYNNENSKYNIFAIEILMPKELIEYLVLKNKYDIHNTSCDLMLSDIVVYNRIKNLKI